MTFDSEIRRVGETSFPERSGVKVMMMPVDLADPGSLPNEYGQYRPMFADLLDMAGLDGGTGYLTIHEKDIPAGGCHRRPGLHVDGIYRDGQGGWGGGWGGLDGMLSVSDRFGCRAWLQEFGGWPAAEGSCDHLRDQLRPDSLVELGSGEVYWLSPFCVHESVPQPAPISRTFVRLSYPSTAPWFEGYTENPKGIRPTGPILPRRPYMDTETRPHDYGLTRGGG